MYIFLNSSMLIYFLYFLSEVHSIFSKFFFLLDSLIYIFYSHSYSHELSESLFL